MAHKIGLAMVCLPISAGLYLLVGGLMFVLFPGQANYDYNIAREDDNGFGLAFAVGMFIFCLALVAGIEVVAYGLHRRKHWAWVAGRCIFVIYVPSLFLPLGALGLWGLLDAGSRREFGVGKGSGHF